ncbi:MAG: isoprenylcysteine carboxylmethyltransferase family protein [Nitrospirae bacterium]|nr:MAG: isoprenylcysteine carboxylmethyltransferase family protein [Nitrospirota bacterium]
MPDIISGHWTSIFNSMAELPALVVIMVWPVIPLFWIPVHGLPKVFKKLGLLSYIVPAVLWLPLAFIIYSNRMVILSGRVGLPGGVIAAGSIIFILGAGLQVWTARLLTMKGIMGMPEVSAAVEGRFVTSGPFAVVRHPTYLSHTLMFLGIFLMTGFHALGYLTLLDLLLVALIIIPLEDRELSGRFGPAYDEYRKRVPAFFPFKRPGRNR